jgi:hypothetical protein
MSGLQPEKKPDGSWSYPHSVDVLEKAGLETITHYTLTLTDCGKFHHKLTNLGTLCGSGAEEGFADLTLLVESANGLGLGKGEGPSAPLHADYGACNC